MFKKFELQILSKKWQNKQKNKKHEGQLICDTHQIPHQSDGMFFHLVFLVLFSFFGVGFVTFSDISH